MNEKTAIKVYKEVSYLETFDWEEFSLDIPIKQLKEIINNSDKFIDLGNYYLNKSTIKKIYTKKVDDIDNTILNIADKELRLRVEREIKARRNNGQRVNQEILSNVIARCQN